MQVPLEVIAPLDLKKLDGITLGLSGDHQLVNAGLAVSLSRCWLQRTGNWDKLFPNVCLLLLVSLKPFIKTSNVFYLLNLVFSSGGFLFTGEQ